MTRPNRIGLDDALSDQPTRLAKRLHVMSVAEWLVALAGVDLPRSAKLAGAGAIGERASGASSSAPSKATCVSVEPFHLFRYLDTEQGRLRERRASALHEERHDGGLERLAALVRKTVKG